MLDDPVITDAEYDDLYDELTIDSKQQYPEFFDSNSPTQKVGALQTQQTGLKEVKHSLPMLSLDNAFKNGDIADFIQRVRDFFIEIKNNPLLQIEYVVEPKIDGVSCSIKYVNHQLVQAVTRGDGDNR